jgi:type II secretory pathway predicted ATPase ExeA
MYETHFGFRHRPFCNTPDSVSYYPATGHEWALDRLQVALLEDEGLLLLTGEPGTGKTLLCHRLLERIGPQFTYAFLTNSHLPDRASLLQAVLYDLGIAYEGKKEQELRLALTDFLLAQYKEGRRTILLVDEAQHLSPDLLEELRLLGNLEARNGKAIQVLLAGQPAVLETLQRADLTGFCQRLSVRVRLEPLDRAEAADYLVHHVRAAGAHSRELFTEEALEVLVRASAGLPRVLNQAAHQALALAHRAGVTQIDAEVAIEALEVLGFHADHETDDESRMPAMKNDLHSGANGKASQISPGLSIEIPEAPKHSGEIHAQGNGSQPPRRINPPGRRPA